MKLSKRQAAKLRRLPGAKVVEGAKTEVVWNEHPIVRKLKLSGNYRHIEIDRLTGECIVD